MATLYSDLALKARDVKMHTRPGSKEQDGTVRMVRATYTMTGAEANGDVIEIAPIPPGAVINWYKAEVLVETGGLAAAPVLTLGVDTVAAIDMTETVQTAGGYRCVAGLALVPPIGVNGTPGTNGNAGSFLTMTFGGAPNTPVAGKKIEIWVPYVLVV